MSVERRSALIGLGVSVVVFFVLAAGIGLWARGYVEQGIPPDHPRVSVSAFVVAAFALGLAVHSFFGRAAYAVAITMLGWAPLLCVLGHEQLARELVRGATETRSFRLDALLVLASLGALVAAAALAPLVPPRDLRWFARAVWIGGVLLAALGFVRLRTQPDPDSYLDTLPVVGVVPQLGEGRVAGLMVRMPQRSDYQACWLEEASAPRHLTSGTLSCAGVSVLRDDANDLWILRQTSAATRGNPGQAALRGTPPVQVDAITPRTIARSLAPPVGWVHGAAGGLFFALLALVAGALFRGSGDRARSAGAHASALAIVVLSCATLAVAAVAGL